MLLMKNKCKNEKRFLYRILYNEMSQKCVKLIFS